MPNWGAGNQKAIDARARKAAAKSEQREAVEKKRMDEQWRDDITEAKVSKKEKMLQKKQEILEKKQQLKQLADEEERRLSDGRKKAAVPAKVTRAEIHMRALRAQQEAKAAAKVEEPENTAEWAFAVENPNKLKAAEAAAAAAAGVELVDSIDAMIGTKQDPGADRFLSKRMKAAFEAYEARVMEALKEEFPSLKRSQLKDKIWKQWQKAPENPMNQIEKTL